MDFGLREQVAMVTGGGSGIGATVALQLAGEGCSVAVVDINEKGANAVTEDIVQAGGRAVAVHCDVSDEASVQQALHAVRRRLGAPGILVNNAGFTRDMKITRMTVADWDSVVDVILKGAFLCSRSVLPDMALAGHGRIINISSRAHLGNPGQTNYSSAKAGIIGLTRALALEWGKHNVTVNAVAPGIIETDAVKALPHYEKIRDAAVRSTPIPRLGATEDVANAIVFLASRLSAYITGETLHVTGGRY